MKLLLSLITLVVLVVAIVTRAGGGAPQAAPVATSEVAAAVPILDCETAADIKAMPSCKAVLEKEASCVYLFKTAAGQKFYIGSPASPPEVIQFLQTLKSGRTYKFPDAFLAYEKKQPGFPG
jgi:hypothetical protein